jgi:hypothetical protein
MEILIVGLKFIRAGLAIISMIGSGVRIGVIFHFILVLNFFPNKGYLANKILKNLSSAW